MPRAASLPLVALLVCVVPARALATPPPTYLLWDTTSLGVEPQTAQLVHDLLGSELRRTLGPQLVDEPAGLTPQTRGWVDACGSSECLAEAIAALAVDRAIAGTITVLGDSYSLQLKVIDGATGKESARAKTTLSGERARMLEALQRLVYEVVDPTLLIGSLALDVSLEGAAVWIDGKEVGRTPMTTPILGLATGEHILKLTSPFMKDYFTFFTVQAGKATRVEVHPEQVAALKAEIEAAEQPLYLRWYFWAAVTTGLGAAATTAYLLTRDEAGGAPSTSLGTIDLRP